MASVCNSVFVVFFRCNSKVGMVFGGQVINLKKPGCRQVYTNMIVSIEIWFLERIKYLLRYPFIFQKYNIFIKMCIIQSVIIILLFYPQNHIPFICAENFNIWLNNKYIATIHTILENEVCGNITWTTFRYSYIVQ